MLLSFAEEHVWYFESISTL